MYSFFDVKDDERFMRIALSEAEKAAKEGEVPVGAVLVHEGEVIATAHNRRENEKNALKHAEIIAIEKGCEVLGGWRLCDCTLYVTLEPCPMCAGALINARVARVVYGAKDARAGALASVMNISAYPLGHKMLVTGGVMAERSIAVLREFFAKKRS